MMSETHFLLWITLEKDFPLTLTFDVMRVSNDSRLGHCRALILLQKPQSESSAHFMGKDLPALKMGGENQTPLWLNIWGKGSKTALLMQLNLLKSCTKMSTVLLVVQYNFIHDFTATFFKLLSYHTGDFVFLLFNQAKGMFLGAPVISGTLWSRIKSLHKYWLDFLEM